MNKKRLCVFCGAKDGQGTVYKNLASEIGKNLVKLDIGLIYGGANIGLMGTLADSVMKNGGEVVGVIPKSILKLEVSHPNLSRLIEVEDMHSRKKKMYDMSHGFLALPGGFGTLDELFEVLTWSQLNIHIKPVYIFNLNGFFDRLLDHLNFLVGEGFLAPTHRNLIKELTSPEEIEKELRL